jgi:hypothetical protein
MPPLHVGSGEDESDAVAVIRELLDPTARLSTIGRIQPDSAFPRERESILVAGVAPVRWKPVRGGRIRGTRIKVEAQAEGVEDLRRRPPLVGRAFIWCVRMRAAEAAH